MILIEPPSKDSPLLPMKHILSVIDEHAAETALLLLPGIQFYSGQFFDMCKITEYAQSKGITVGWDLAHVVGNVPVQLHDWNIDFAVWCTYKYMNSGPFMKSTARSLRRTAMVQAIITAIVLVYQAGGDPRKLLDFR
jgi:kynureninase